MRQQDEKKAYKGHKPRLCYDKSDFRLETIFLFTTKELAKLFKKYVLTKRSFFQEHA